LLHALVSVTPKCDHVGSVRSDRAATLLHFGRLG